MNDAKHIGPGCLSSNDLGGRSGFRWPVGHGSYLGNESRTILQFIHGLRGSLHVPFEEGTWAAWLHDLLKPHVTQVLVCDPRKNNLGKVGNKNDRHDARELAELLYRNKLEPVYHGEQGLRTLKELARGYLALTRDSLAQ
jgi:transposase